MYTEQELIDIQKQQKKRWLTLLIPEAILIIAITVVFIVRTQRVLDDTTAQIILDILSIIAAAILIGGWGLLIKPLHSYEKYLQGVLFGMSHVIEDGTFAHLDTDISMVDGVACYGLTVSRVNEKQKTYEQLFYYDAQKPRPEFTEGQQLRITYHDRAIRQVEAIN